MHYLKAILFLLIMKSTLFSQTVLRVSYNRLGSVKIYHIAVNEVLEYKLKGEFRFKKNKIINMHDSTILLDNYTEIQLNQIKVLRLGKNNFLVTKFKKFFFDGAVLFISLSVVNNLIIHTTPVLNKNAVYVSAALFVTGFLIKEIGIKRIRITKRKSLKIYNRDYEHLNIDDKTH